MWTYCQGQLSDVAVTNMRACGRLRDAAFRATPSLASPGRTPGMSLPVMPGPGRRGKVSFDDADDVLLSVYLCRNRLLSFTECVSVCFRLQFDALFVVWPNYVFPQRRTNKKKTRGVYLTESFGDADVEGSIWVREVWLFKLWRSIFFMANNVNVCVDSRPRTTPTSIWMRSLAGTRRCLPSFQGSRRKRSQRKRTRWWPLFVVLSNCQMGVCLHHAAHLQNLTAEKSWIEGAWPRWTACAREKQATPIWA